MLLSLLTKYINTTSRHYFQKFTNITQHQPKHNPLWRKKRGSSNIFWQPILESLHHKQPSKHLRPRHNRHEPAPERHLIKMSDLARSDTLDMPCPLLDKLAPETRVLIYEYVLSFETPVKHATNLQPFLQKLTTKSNMEIPFKHAPNVRSSLQEVTGAKSNSETEDTGMENESDWESNDGEDGSDLETTEAEPESSPSTEAAGELELLCLVNTSILTASKLIYTEAIAVFYKSNTISIDAQFCGYKTIESPNTTDLSLVKQVVTKIDLAKMSQHSKEEGFGPVEFSAIRVAMVAIPAICPNLRSSKLFMYVDSKFLFDLAAMMRVNPIYSEAAFDGVGSVTACSKRNRNLQLAIQCRETMESWAALTDNIPPATLHPLHITAGSVYRASRGDPQGTYAQYARNMFNAASPAGVPAGYGAIDYDSHEFWTIIDQFLNTYQRVFRV